ncbi:sigma-70 family RNA polymerase sigma factor [Hyalangium rubrum]|uniref:Sigma-70 family RNA polymerase sigma factor n=1 Tax=Hyalangium rubrum TaxID=3103134 RepID=A0ABU5GX03_9BACT|nr:sigma-70 family RNA polymerase sigma factor [Hyalangium sp. s54d21]MDY7225072.1 sigma-70 family RNA polymerase sigma factor [Hyalangium sp. s54d21]
MEVPLKLATTFFEHAPGRPSTPSHLAEFENLLRGAWETGQSPWPGVLVPAEVFVRHLARLLPEVSDAPSLSETLGQLTLEDLYLACACVHGVPDATDVLERNYLARLPAVLAYLRLPSPLLEDLCQMVRIHLLLGTSESGPRLADYTGRGALLSWMRVIAARMALRLGPQARETPDENVLAALESLQSPDPDAELDLIKRRYRPMFLQAIREAFDALSSEQRHLLRLHFVDRLPTTRMAPLFGVDQSTVSRWIKAARQAVYEDTKRLLKGRLRLSSREFESLTAAIDSHLDLSFSQILQDDEPEKK